MDIQQKFLKMTNINLINWTIAHDYCEKYEYPYLNGLNMDMCFHFKIDLSFFNKNDYLIIHPINAEDFVQIILYLTKMQTKYWKLPFAKVIPSCIDQLNYIRNNLYKNIIVYNDIRVVKDELIVPIAYSTESEIISASFATLILSTTLWKKFYKCHKKQIDDGIYEEFEKEEE